MRITFTKILLFILLFIAQAFTLQAQHLKWHHVLKGAEVHDFKSDAAGNMYIIAKRRYNYAVYFNDSLCYQRHEQLDRFIIKISPKGELVWHKNLTGSGTHHFLQIDKDQNIITCFNGGTKYSKIFVEKYRPDGSLITKAEFNVKNPKTGNRIAYQVFLHDFAIYNNNFYFLVYSDINTSIEGTLLNDNIKHFLIKADFTGNIKWAINVGIPGGRARAYLSTEDDGNLLVTVSNPTVYSGFSYVETKENASRIYRISSEGNILKDHRFPEFKRYATFRAINISPGNKICVAALVDSQAIINGQVYSGNTLLLMYLNKDLSINKYVTAKGNAFYVNLAMDTEDNFYTFGTNASFTPTFPPYYSGITFGDSTINQKAGLHLPLSFFSKTDSLGKPSALVSLGKYRNPSDHDVFIDKAGWAIVNNCKQIYIGADFNDTLVFDNISLNPELSSLGWGNNFLIASIENNSDSIKTQLQPLCNKVLACNAEGTKGFNKFHWDFGDGQSSTEKSPIHVYDTSGTYIVTLTCSTSLGCQKIITDTVYVPASPQANFSFQSSTGCQWVGFRFKDSSFADTLHQTIPQTWHWNFGDGTTDTARNPVHIYTKSGNYSVRLVYSNGFCSDTFTTTQQTNILEAPKPGFSVSLTKGCTPLQVKIQDQSEGEVIKYFYDLGNGKTDTLASTSLTYAKPGIYKIKQSLLGATGCITSDSVFITVLPGVTPQTKPQLQWASVNTANNTSTEVSWQKVPAAANYLVYRKNTGSKADFMLQKETNALTFTDSTADASQTSFIYKIIAKDSCGNLSAESNIGKTMLLRAKNENNDFALLQWSPYEDWKPAGIATYTIEVFDDSTDDFIPLSQLNNNSNNITSYKDYDFWSNGNRKQERCYRIKAISAVNNNNNSEWQSTSNSVCLPYMPQIWVPTAFSPNGDGLNDVFKIVSTAIASLELQIFSRWGERICTITNNNNNDGWDGTLNGEKLPAGEYIYVLKAKGIGQQNFYSSGSLQLLR